MYGYESVERPMGKGLDLEAGDGSTLYPGLSYGENQLRWGFIRKVYGILATQIVLTTAVSAVTVLYSPVAETLKGSPGLAIGLAILPFVLLFPLYQYQQKHPLNFVFLGLFTLCLSLSVGVACASTEGTIVLEALVITSTVVLSLTGYTFWASKKGKDFSFLGPFLFAALIVLLVTSFVQVEENICKFAKKGLTPSQIGVFLCDSHNIAQVKSVTGIKILRILKAHGFVPTWIHISCDHWWAGSYCFLWLPGL